MADLATFILLARSERDIGPPSRIASIIAEREVPIPLLKLDFLLKTVVLTRAYGNSLKKGLALISIAGINNTIIWPLAGRKVNHASAARPRANRDPIAIPQRKYMYSDILYKRVKMCENIS
jgi:hypothetical protein